MTADAFPVLEAVAGLADLEPCLGALQGLYRRTGPSHPGRVLAAAYGCALPNRIPESGFGALWCLGADSQPDCVHVAALMEAVREADVIVLVQVAADLSRGTVRTADQVEYRAHLGPMDWALAIFNALASADKTGGAYLEVPRIRVLDLLPPSIRPQPAFDASLLPALQVVDGANDEWLKAILNDLSDPTWERNRPMVSKQVLGRLTHQWLASLAESGESGPEGAQRHHMLNNLLGPLALAVELDPQNERGLWGAVAKKAVEQDEFGRLALMRAISWNRRLGPDVPAATEPLDIRPDRELRILVLDDQLEDGWIPILGYILGFGADAGANTGKLPKDVFTRVAANGSLGLWVATGPEAVRRKLSEPPRRGWPSPLRLAGTVQSDKAPGFDEVLLLDLRLFTSRDPIGAKDAFEAWVQQALGEPWVQFSDHHARRLTGLSRLVAKRDFGYPVIIWSTTGRRDVIDDLREVRSVSTGTAKPKFDVYGNVASDFVASLRDAVDVSLRTCAAARWVGDWFQHGPASRTGALYGRFRVPKEPSERLVSIYLDESKMKGDKDYRHGGLVIVATGPGGGHVGRQARLVLLKAATDALIQDFSQLSFQSARGRRMQLDVKDYIKDAFTWGDRIPNTTSALSAMVAAARPNEGTVDLTWFLCAMPARPTSRPSRTPALSNPDLDFGHYKTLSEFVSALTAILSLEKMPTAFVFQADGRVAPVDLSAPVWLKWWRKGALDFALRKKSEFDSTRVAGVHVGQRVEIVDSTKKDDEVVQEGTRGSNFVLQFNGSTWDILMPTVIDIVLHALASAVTQTPLLGRNDWFEGVKTLRGTAESIRCVADFVPRNLIEWSGREGRYKLHTEVASRAPVLVDLGEVATLEKFLDGVSLARSTKASAGAVLARCHEAVCDLKAASPHAPVAPDSLIACLIAKASDLTLRRMQREDFWNFRDKSFSSTHPP